MGLCRNVRVTTQPFFQKAMKRLILSLFVILNCLSSSASLEEVRSAIRNEYLSSTPSPQTAVWAKSLNRNGQWRDIDYTDRSRALWQLERHLDRLIDMALAYEQAPDKNKKTYQAIVRGLGNWFDNGYRNSNWWYTKIGIPRRMLSLAYILDSDLPPALHDSIANAISIIDSDDFPARPGGDRIQVLSNHAKVLVWKRDFAGATALFRKIEEEARIAPFEEIMYDAAGGPAGRNTYMPAGRGVQADMTFHHRGDRINSTLSYGMELPEFFSYWAALLRNTDCRFDARRTHFVIDYYLDAVCRHLVAGRYAEPSIMNRELARPGEGIFSPHLANQLLSISDGYRADELQHFADVQAGKAIHSASYAHHFWQSDYFVFSRPNFQTAVRIHSMRNANSEAAHNSEGLRNHFRGDGACMLSVTGREYADMAPLTDFRMIPGTTTPMIAYEPLSAWGSVHILDNPTRFAGAVCDSLYGAVAFDFISPRSDLRARKAWFFFDNEYLCLGSAVCASGSDSIVTTVEQCLSPSATLQHSGDWFFHAGSGYHIIDGNAEGSVTHRRGTWRNCVDHVDYIDDPMEADVFSLAIHHGIAPRNATYAYAVVPGTDRPAAHGFRILANTPEVQAVANTDGSIVYIVFYEKGEIDTPAGRYGAQQPCMMMLRNGKLRVADPARRYYLLKIATPQGDKEIQIPTNSLAGTSVEVAF